MNSHIAPFLIPMKYPISPALSRNGKICRMRQKRNRRNNSSSAHFSQCYDLCPMSFWFLPFRSFLLFLGRVNDKAMTWR